MEKYVYTTIDRSNNHVDMIADPRTPYRFTSNPFTAPDGTTVIVRRVFESVEGDRMEGYLEVSKDGGETWRRVYNQHLKRIP